MPLPKKRVYFPQLSDVTKFQRQFTQNTQDIIALRNALNAGVGTVVAGGGPAIENIYADVATMFADQTNQTAQSFQRVDDASGDIAVTTGYAYYEYLGTVVGDITDYKLVVSEESLGVIAGSTTPTTTLGDMIVRGAVEDKRLPKGATSDVLVMGADEPEWQTPSTVPVLRLSHSAIINLQIAEGSTEVLPWDTQDAIDTDTYIHDTVTNNSRIYVNVSGIYLIKWDVFAVSAGANRLSWESRLRIDGVAQDIGRRKNYSRGSLYGSGINAEQNIEVSLTAGQYIEATIYVQDAEQTSAVNSIAASQNLVVKKIDGLGGTKGDKGDTGVPGGIPSTLTISSDELDAGNYLGNIYNEEAPYVYSGTISFINLASKGFGVLRITTAGETNFPLIDANGGLNTQVSGDSFQADYIYEMLFRVIGTTKVEYGFIGLYPS